MMLEGNIMVKHIDEMLASIDELFGEEDNLSSDLQSSTEPGVTLSEVKFDSNDSKIVIDFADKFMRRIPGATISDSSNVDIGMVSGLLPDVGPYKGIEWHLGPSESPEHFDFWVSWDGHPTEKGQLNKTIEDPSTESVFGAGTTVLERMLGGLWGECYKGYCKYHNFTPFEGPFPYYGPPRYLAMVDSPPKFFVVPYFEQLNKKTGEEKVFCVVLQGHEIDGKTYGPGADILGEFVAGREKSEDAAFQFVSKRNVRQTMVFGSGQEVRDFLGSSGWHPILVDGVRCPVDLRRHSLFGEIQQRVQGPDGLPDFLKSLAELVLDEALERMPELVATQIENL